MENRLKIKGISIVDDKTALLAYMIMKNYMKETTKAERAKNSQIPISIDGEDFFFFFNEATDILLKDPSYIPHGFKKGFLPTELRNIYEPNQFEPIYMSYIKKFQNLDEVVSHWERKGCKSRFKKKSLEILLSNGTEIVKYGSNVAKINKDIDVVKTYLKNMYSFLNN